MNNKLLLFAVWILLANSAQAQPNDSLFKTKDSLIQNNLSDSILQNSLHPQVNQVNQENQDSKPKPATLYIYRPGSFIGAVISYELYKGDQVICRIRNNSRCQIEIEEEGLIELWAKTEKKKTIHIYIVPGQSYYLKCGTAVGVFVGRPEMTIISAEQGESEFAKIKD
jgi:hypothetical protein